MLFYLFILILIVLVAALFFVSKQPDEFCTTRSIKIAAPAPVIFPYINDLKRFNQWNPWAKMDPNSTVTFEGADQGDGAKMSWKGNNAVGQGAMTNIETRTNELIRFKMDFLKPMKATNFAEFSLKSEGDFTVVSWSMKGKNNFISKLFHLLVNCDKMVGTQFEKGLADLKLLAEQPAK